MSKSTSNRPQNDIPEDEQPLGGVYDEDKESDQIDSIKDNISDIKDRTLDTKDDIEDLINRFKGDQEDYSSSYDSQYRDNEATKTNENSKEESNGNSKNKDLKEDASERGERNRSSGLKNEGKSGHHSPNTAKPGNTGSNGIANASNATNIRPGVGGVGATGTGTAGATTAGATSAGATTAGAASAGATSAGSTAVAAAAPALPIILIVIILVIGIIGFFTVMPGMILGKLKKFGFRILEGLKGATTGNSKIVTQEELKGVAQYIQNLGYDIQSYGFADVKYKKPTKKDLEDNKVSTNKEISKIVPVNRDLANDYLSAYITADAQTYVAADTFLFAKVINAWDNIRALMNNDELKSIDQSSSGLINILNHKIPFINSKDTVDNAEDYAVVNTEKRKLYINTKVFTINIPILSELSTAVLGKNKAKVQIRRGSSYSFDLESWTAMYGRPLELFLALHTSTMMPDLTKQIATNDKFNTKVNIDLMRVNMLYDVELKKQDGNTLKFSTDIENTDNPDQKAIDNLNAFIDDFLNNAVEPNNSSIWKDAKDIVNDAMSTNPKAKIQFFKKIHDASKKKGFFSTSDKFDYVDIAKTFQTLDNDPFENLSEEDKKACEEAWDKDIELRVDNCGRVYDEADTYIADVVYQESSEY